MGLDGFAQAYPRELSGGMRMRVSVARALLTRPSVLLMDEPFAAVDEITRFDLIEDLLGVWQGQPWTIVFVTHSVYESVYMSQRVVIMGTRPGHVIGDIAIAEPYPRGQSFRSSARYADYCRQVLDSLRAARTRAFA
jgi:NitT/TauT family transport system ATP-binding protein